jgi:hypothetical protein
MGSLSTVECVEYAFVDRHKPLPPGKNPFAVKLN